mgnify:FL=1
MDRPKVGIGIVTLNGNKVLLGKRKGAHGAGEWSLPGGHLEARESFEDCCKREVLEETGLEIKNKIEPIPYFSNDVFEKEDLHYVTLFFRAFEVEDLNKLENKEPNKCDGWQWFNLNELPENMFKPAKKLFKDLVLVNEIVTRKLT